MPLLERTRREPLQRGPHANGIPNRVNSAYFVAVRTGRSFRPLLS
jgi:hypothetical protein